MKSTNYSDKTLEHFREPRNVGTLEGENVALGRVGNPVCGDLMEMYIRVEDDRVADIKFQTFGCGSAVATSSMTTELVKGMTLDDALKVSRGDVADALDGLPPIKMHCSNLAADALHAAVENWRAGIKPEDADTTPVEGKCGTGAPAEAESVDADAIDGLASFAGLGAYASVDDRDEFKDQRVVVIENGDASAQAAIDLCDTAARVVLMTTGTELSNVSQPVRMALKLSDVKVLYEAKPLEVAGEGEVERVRVHDLNEDEEYELAADAVLMLDSE
jgi:nitrogen fixation NifU-like protein